MHRKVQQSLPLEWRDTRDWARPPDGSLEGEKLSDYERAKRAVERYVQGDKVASILEDEAMDLDTLYRLFERCVLASPGGSIYGFTALIPYSRLEPYQRKSEANAGLLEAGIGASGLFQSLLSEIPDARDWVAEAAKKYVGDEWLKRRIPVQHEHKKFLRKLATVRSLEKYPFNVTNQGSEGFRLALKAAIDVRRAEVSGNYKPSITRKFLGETGLAFFRNVQIDAHKADRLFPVKVYGKGGKFVIRLVRLQWVVGGEANSMAGLGHRLCRGKEPQEVDVRYCLFNMMSKWKKRAGPFTYASEESGLPSGQISSCNGRYAAAIWMDNALCNHAIALQEDITRCLYATVKTGRAATPETREEIEQVFNNVTHQFVQHLPRSISPSMSKAERKRIIKLVEHDAMSYDEIEALFDVGLCDLNAAESSRHYSKSPLDVLEDEPQEALRMLDSGDDASWTRLLTIVEDAYVRAAPGHVPHVNYYGAEYSSPLIRSMALVDVEVTIKVDLTDLRRLEAFMKNGMSLGFLEAQNGWDEFKHDLALRKTLLQAIRTKRFSWLAAEPLDDQLVRFLKSRGVLMGSEPVRNISSADESRHREDVQAPVAAVRRLFADVLQQGEMIDLEDALGDELEG